MSREYRCTIYSMHMGKKTCEADLINLMLPNQALDPRRSKPLDDGSQRFPTRVATT